VNARCISSLAKEHPNLQNMFWMRTVKVTMDLGSKMLLDEYLCTRCFDSQNALESLNNCFRLVIYDDWFKWLVISCLPPSVVIFMFMGGALEILSKPLHREK